MGGTTFTALGSQELSLKDLKDYPLICLGKETMTFQFYNKLFLSYGLALEPDTETATTDQILPLVKSELGLALSETIPKRNICMVYDSQHPLNEAARQLKKVILESR